MDRIEELKNDLENYYKDMKAKIEEVEKEELKKAEAKKRWRAEVNEKYYCINEKLECGEATETLHRLDDKRYKYRNYFQEREQAEKVAERIKIYSELKNLAEELNEGEKIDWENGKQNKYSISYDAVKLKKFNQYNYVYNKDIGQIYCLDEDFLEIAKEKIGEDRLRKLFEEE